MESMHGNGGSRLVVKELSLIKDLVRQLEVHLGGSPDLCKHLASQIFSITERSIGIITASNLDGGGRKRSAADAGLSTAATPSPMNDVSDVPFRTTKKRKTMEKRKYQVRVSSAGGGVGSPVDDGHSWRKYGQKEILGAKHPRGYYRCTHRHSQGCPATKQVQRTDDDTTLFDVIYHGDHTCGQRAAPAAGQAAAATQPPERSTDAQLILQSLSASLTVQNERPAVPAVPQGRRAAATPFCSSSTPASGCFPPERSPFSGTETPENWVGSPATSGSDHAACFPPFEATAGDAELVSALVEAATSAPEPTVDMDFADEFLNLDSSVDNLDQSILSYFANPYVADEQ